MVIPIAIIVLVGLFMVQRRGTARSARRLVRSCCSGSWSSGFSIAEHHRRASVLRAVNPIYALSFIHGEFWLAFLSLGSVVLCVTGAEALYADMGSVRTSSDPAGLVHHRDSRLYLNYFGQAALGAA